MIDPHTVNPFLLTKEEELSKLRQHQEYSHELVIPRRPHWDETTTAEQLKVRDIGRAKGLVIDTL